MGVSDYKAYKTEISKKIIFVIASFILRFLIIFHVLSLRRIFRAHQKAGNRAR
jgi:uncharacterized membrane protein YvbJ